MPDVDTSAGESQAASDTNEHTTVMMRNIPNDYSSWACASHKICEVSWANPNQGQYENVERYRNSPVMHESVPDAFKPRLFVNGMRIAFPPPTKRVRAPRIRPARRQ